MRNGPGRFRAVAVETPPHMVVDAPIGHRIERVCETFKLLGVVTDLVIGKQQFQIRFLRKLCAIA